MADPTTPTEDRIDDKAAPVEASSSSTGFKGSFIALREPAFRNLWFGMLFQMSGQQMAVFTRGYLVFELTGSATLLGVVSGAMTVPIVTLGLFGGVLADRLDKGRMIQAAQVLTFVIALGTGLVIATGALHWVHLLIASLGHGVVIAFLMATRQAIIPQLVPKDRLTNAIALNSMGMSTATVAAPALAGVLIGVIGAQGVHYVMAGMHGGAIVLTQLLPRLQNAGQDGRRSLLEELVDGLRYVRATRQILLLMALSFSTFLFIAPLKSILPVFAKDVFGLGAGGLGVMIAAMGVGSLLGAFAIAGASKAQGRGLRALLVSVLSGIVLLGFSLTSSLTPAVWIGLGFLTAVGATMPMRMILINSLLLENTAPEFQGRMMSILFLGMGLAPAVVIPLGVLTDAIGAPAALTVMAACMLTLVGILFVASPVLRRIQ